MTNSRIGNMAIQLGLNLTNFTSDWKKATNANKKNARKMQKDMEQSIQAISVAVAGSVAGLAVFISKTAETADSISKMSQKLGVSVDFLSKYDFIAGQAGVNIERLGDGMKDMEKKVGDANRGLSAAKESFSSIGISIEQLNRLAPEQQFQLISESLAGVENQSLKVATAMEIFGESGFHLIPLFELTREEIEKLNEENKRFGAVIGDVQAKAAVEYADSMDALKRNAEGLSQTISFTLMPALTEIIDQFNDSTVRDTGDDFDVLNTILVGTYSLALDLNSVFAAVGNALGQVAAHSINSFKLMASGLEIFVKKVERGGLIIGSIFSESADEASRTLGLEIAELEKGFDAIFETVAGANNEFQSLGFFDSLEDNDKKIEKVRAAYAKFKTEVKKSKKDVQGAGKDIGNIGTQSGLSEAELKILTETMDELKKEYQSIFDSFLTPMQKLNKQYDENIAKIKEYQAAHKDNELIQGETNFLISELTEKYEADTKAINDNAQAIKDQKSPYEQLIQSMIDELDLLGKKGTDLTRSIAIQDLARVGVTAAALGQEEYNKQLATYLGILGKIDASNTAIGFDQKITGISDLINSIETMSSAFNKFGKDIGKGLQGLAQGFSGVINSIASISNSFANGSLFKSLGQVAGVVSVAGQISGFINNLTGGGLFGTSYSTTGSTQNFDVGSNGGSGFIETSESKKRSLFRGTKRRTSISDLANEAQQSIESLFATIESIIATSSLSVGGNLDELISGAFKQTFDKDGNLTNEFSTIFGQRYEETLWQFSQRLIAENIIGVLDSVLPQVEHTVTQFIRDFENIEFGSTGLIPVTSTIQTGEANALADNYRDLGAEALLEFANFALKAVADIQAGNELLASLTDTTALTESLGKANETLSETYERVASATQVFDSALDIIGVSFDLTREEFIKFSVDIAEASGGLQEASSLWQSYFDTFYTADELLDKRIADATTIRDDLLGDLGLDFEISTEDFRTQFENLLPTLTPEQINQWLEAGRAIGVVLDLGADIAAQAEAETAASLALLEAAVEQAAANALALSNFMDGISSAMEDLDLSPFAKTLKGISKAFNEQIKTARELGASERELAMIQAYATRQIQDAIRALESNITLSINDLFGTQLDIINSEIIALQEQQSLSQQLAQASNQRYQNEIAALANLADYIDSIFLNPTLTTLNPFEQLQEAQSQFDALFNQAQGGDASAINALPGIANTLLGLGRDVFSSSPDFTALFDSITGQLSSLGINGPSSDLVNVNTADPRLIELQTQQAALLEEIAAGERFQEILKLADEIAELTSVTGESFSDLAERLGLPIEEFITELGVNLDDLTIDTATALADVAQLLGIELTELADSVGISLGDLADSESLLNDALETAINTLPEGIQGTLGGLLEDVENAADGTEQVEKLALLEEYAASLPEDQRAALEPFFNQIDPTSDAQRQIDSMDAVNTTNQQIGRGINELREANNENNESVLGAMTGIREAITDLSTRLDTIAAQNQS